MTKEQLRQLRATKAEKVKALSGLIEAAAARTPQRLTDEEKAQVATLKAEIADLTALIETGDGLDEVAATEAARVPASQMFTEQAARERAQHTVAVRDRAEDDPKRGFRSPREFMRCVMDASVGRRVDERLKPLYQATAGSDEQGGYSDPYGGFLLPVGFSPDVLAIQSEADPTAGQTRDLPMDVPSVKINARVDKDHASSVSGGLIVYRHAETTAITPTRVQLEQLSFDAAELIGAAYATESVMTDSPSSFIALISGGFADEFAAKILKEKLRGTGTGGQFLGVLNSPCLVTVAKESGQAADTVLTENIDKMAARCWRYNQAIWLANQTTRPQLRGLVRAVGTGGAPVPYFTTDAGQERLDGRPIFFTEFASKVGDVGDLILGNWREYIEGLYQPMQQAESIHVRFLNHERAFKFWLRNAGMPWWRSALTPANGDTLSPFVTLAAR